MAADQHQQREAGPGGGGGDSWALATRGSTWRRTVEYAGARRQDTAALLHASLEIMATGWEGGGEGGKTGLSDCEQQSQLSKVEKLGT